MIWIPVIVLASIIGYLKRENLHLLYNSRYWAIAAMVSGLKGETHIVPTIGLAHLHLRFYPWFSALLVHSSSWLKLITEPGILV